MPASPQLPSKPESSLLYLRHLYLRFLFSGFLGCLSRSLFALLPCTEVAYEDAFSVAVELDHAERQFVAYCYRALVLFLEVASRAEGLYAFLERYNSALVGQLNYLTLNLLVNTELSLELFPRILLELLVAQAQTTVSYVDVEYYDLDLCTDLTGV